MTPDQILGNSFFAFWYIYGGYLFAIWGFGTAVSIILGLIYLVARR